MNKIILFAVLTCLLIIGGQIFAEPPEPPMFENCDSTILSVRFCETVEHQVSASIPGRRNNNNIRYKLMSGPGEVDPRTGMWSWTPLREDSVDRYSWVEIAAMIGNNEKSISDSTDRCYFQVAVMDAARRVTIDNKEAYSVFHLDTYSTYTYRVDLQYADSCQLANVRVGNIDPQPVGTVEYSDGLLIFNLDPADAEKKFVVSIEYPVYSRWQETKFIFDTRSDPTPVLVNCPESQTISTCVPFEYNFLAEDPDYMNFPFGIEYHLISGPGSIRYFDGRYYFEPGESDIGSTYEIEVAASYGDFMTSGDQNCKFSLTVSDPEPGIYMKYYYDDVLCGDTVKNNDRYEPAFILVEAFGSGGCENLPVELVSVSPEPNGLISYEPYGQSLMFALSEEDGGNTYTATLRTEDNGTEYLCDVSLFADWAPPVDPQLTVRVEKLNDIIQGQSTTVDVYLDESNVEIGGFDMILSYDKRVLTFQKVDAGDFINDCAWEYFTYRYGLTSENPYTDSLNFIRVVSIAETNDGANHPSCYIPDNFPSKLFSIDFYVTNDRTYECAYAPIKFYWEDCRDNAVANIYGDMLYVSDKVYETTEGDYPTQVEITDPSTGYPTFGGFQVDSCDTHTSIDRGINYIGGGVEIVCADSIDATGDLNLNGIAYEIADAVLFQMYLVYGSGVFDNYEGSKSASDVNYDGYDLDISDLIYLTRVIIGDAIPMPDPPVEIPEARFYVDKSGGLSVEADQNMGAIFLKIEGNVIPMSALSNMNIGFMYVPDSNFTRVLISSLDGSIIEDGDVLYNLGGPILEIHTGTSDGFRMSTTLDYNTGFSSVSNGSLPDNFSLNQNHPNPFNNATVIEFALPEQGTVNLEIFNVLGQPIYKNSLNLPAGYHSFEWDGKNDSGNDIASGIYYYRITTENYVDTKKMMLLK